MSTSLTAQRQVTRGLAIARAVVGLVFVVHGGQKLFALGYPGTTEAFTHMGVPLPGVTSAIAIVLELLGGLALLLGFYARIAAALLAIEMACAIAIVHLKHGFFAPLGVEFPLTLLAILVALALTGPGALTVDERLARRRHRGPRL